MFIYAILILLPALALADDPLAQLETTLFNAIDANKDGKLTVAEGETYFLTYDTNKDGVITKAEFSSAVDKLAPVVVGHEDALYALFDRDGSGGVNKADIDAVFTVTDADKDNSVSRLEFHLVFQLVITHIG